jgi:hypothetical protein
MTQHNLLDAVEKLLPYAEAEQEAFYKVTLKYPGRQKAKSDYEDCRHAVSYAYEALSEATRKTLPTAAAQTEGKHTPGPWEIVVTVNTGRVNIFSADLSKPYHLGTFVSGSRNDLPTFKANAAFIVRACNAHHALIEALEYVAGHASMARHYANERGWLASLENVEKAARDALA